MGYKHYIFNLQKQVRAGKLTDAEVAARVAARKERAAKNLARQAIYLAEVDKLKDLRNQAYDNRTAIKAGLRESYRQRKNRLNKERRAKLTNQIKKIYELIK